MDILINQSTFDRHSYWSAKKYIHEINVISLLAFVHQKERAPLSECSWNHICWLDKKLFSNKNCILEYINHWIVEAVELMVHIAIHTK